MKQDGCLEETFREMVRYKLVLLRVSEMRWKGQGIKQNEGMTVYYTPDRFIVHPSYMRYRTYGYNLACPCYGRLLIGGVLMYS